MKSSCYIYSIADIHIIIIIKIITNQTIDETCLDNVIFVLIVNLLLFIIY
jgi:hypothetical protein